MAEHIQQVRRVTNDGVTTETTRVDEQDPVAPAAAETNSVSTAARIVWFIAGVLLVLLAFRFVLALLGANPANSFANFIYTGSHPFVAPFFSLFSYNLHYGVSRFETYTLVAMAVYALIAYGIARLVTISKPSHSVSRA